MKKLHLFILKSYLAPLAMTFFITLFILVMQFLWRYVDDMVGKGLDFFVLTELLFYASVQVIPMALPLAILLASLMSFGNLGENYELTAIKASGISLPRTMMPLIIFTIFTSIGAFWFSNNVLPIANLKLYSLLYDVKLAKPELDLKEKIFYSGIDQFSIKINDKNDENNLLYDFMIYDHRDNLNKNSNITLADSGRIQISEDKKLMILTLFDGVRYDEKVGLERKRLRPRDQQMFRTDHFKEEVVLLEMQGHDFSRTDEQLFTHSDKMKNYTQLRHDKDSLTKMRDTLIMNLSSSTKDFHSSMQLARTNQTTNIDSTKTIDPINLANSLGDEAIALTIANALDKARMDKNMLSDQVNAYIKPHDDKIIRHSMELHRKFTLSFACFIFFFIGAPLGAIIRKGGLGMPVVISILFFIIYYIIDTFGAKLAREGVIPVYQGLWLSSFILFPVGAFLTYKSATDSSLLNIEAYQIFFRKLFKREKYDLSNRLDKQNNISPSDN